jgi:predicted homoserine dehydrogenase-like protein
MTRLELGCRGAIPKRALKSGEALDGEGGFTVWDRQVPAAASYAAQALPMGLAQRDRLQRDVAEGAMLTHDDVVLDPQNPAVAARSALIEQFGSVG